MRLGFDTLVAVVVHQLLRVFVEYGFSLELSSSVWVDFFRLRADRVVLRLLVDVLEDLVLVSTVLAETVRRTRCRHEDVGLAAAHSAQR